MAFSTAKYDELKREGNRVDRVKYLLSLTDKSEMEIHLKKTASSSIDDLQLLVILSSLTKNDRNLLEIFHNVSLPIEERIKAANHWITLAKDEKSIEEFLVQTINDENTPR